MSASANINSKNMFNVIASENNFIIGGVQIQSEKISSTPQRFCGRIVDNEVNEGASDTMILPIEVHGMFATNAYFYISDKTNSGFLIDPGAEAGRLLHIVNEYGFTIEKILLTHGHFDHMGAATSIRNRLHAPIYMHANGEKYATNPEWNLSRNYGLNIILHDVNYLEDGDEIVSDVDEDFRLKAIAVPGHTTDGVMYYSAKDHAAFVGDTIFKESFGRTDLHGGNEWTLLESIKQKVLTLPDDTILYSGHTEQTTVAEEKSRPWYAQ